MVIGTALPFLSNGKQRKNSSFLEMGEPHTVFGDVRPTRGFFILAWLSKDCQFFPTLGSQFRSFGQHLRQIFPEDQIRPMVVGRGVPVEDS